MVGLPVSMRADIGGECLDSSKRARGGTQSESFLVPCGRSRWCLVTLVREKTAGEEEEEGAPWGFCLSGCMRMQHVSCVLYESRAWVYIHLKRKSEGESPHFLLPSSSPLSGGLSFSRIF